MWSHAYLFWKIPPSTKKKSPFHIYWFYEYFPAKLIPNDYEGHTCSFRTNLVPFRIRTFRHPLHVWWFCIFCTPSTFILTSTFIREIRVATIPLAYELSEQWWKTIDLLYFGNFYSRFLFDLKYKCPISYPDWANVLFNFILI